MTENQVLIETPEEAIETIKSNMPTSGYQMLRESLEMAITALKEIQQYREMERKLKEAYGDCNMLLENVVNYLYRHECVDMGSPMKSRMLTDGDVDMWDAYRKIGTVEEFRKAVEKQKSKRCNVIRDNFLTYHNCPTCNHLLKVDYNSGSWMGAKSNNCSNCGQAISWKESEEE